MIKQMDVEMTSHENKKQMSLPPTSPPLPPPLPTYWRKPASTTWSATKEEIALFWRRKKITEEEHFNVAIKAAARLRARNLTEEDYRRFEESLNDIDDNDKKNNDNDNDKTNKDGMLEIRVGIKDWWTKSKYAYLNQPAMESIDKPKKTSSYIPNSFFIRQPLNHNTFCLECSRCMEAGKAGSAVASLLLPMTKTRPVRLHFYTQTSTGRHFQL